MTSLHVICGLGPPPIKNPGYAYAAVYCMRHNAAEQVVYFVIKKNLILV